MIGVFDKQCLQKKKKPQKNRKSDKRTCLSFFIGVRGKDFYNNGKLPCNSNPHCPSPLL
jgi:hypothetical protein